MKKNTKIILGVVGVLVVVGIILAIVLPLTLNRGSGGDTPAPEPLRVPDGFRFGAATSSYQIEGAYQEGGKSDSIWDTLTRDLPNTIRNGDNGNVAADSYHLYAEDVKALKDTGVSDKLIDFHQD